MHAFFSATYKRVFLNQSYALNIYDVHQNIFMSGYMYTGHCLV